MSTSHGLETQPNFNTCGLSTETLILLGYRDVPILQHDGGANPLAIPAVRIQFDQPGSRPSAVTTSAKTSEQKCAKLVTRISVYLQGLLLREYSGIELVDRKDITDIMKIRNPLLAAIPPLEALAKLKTELQAYDKGRAPYNRTLCLNKSVLQWWERVHKDEDAQVLGATPQKVPALRRWCDLTANQRINLDSQVSMDELGTGGGDDNIEPNLPGVSGPGVSANESGSGGVPAVDALYEGANMGSLQDERRSEFVVSDIFNLQSPFLREMLTDDEEVAREQREARRAATNMCSSLASVAPTPSGSSAPLPSQAAWGKWAAN
ncbi:hypothetical protein C2E23DRAFT_887416 [Lenzites betulinus]|nr:hypothetical protein C2E23DRAFT_887416 [Lenzites betulinus]